MNPNLYQPRDFLWHQQGDPRWSWKKLALSSRTVGDIGCALMSMNYINNRYRKDHGLSIIYPNTWIDWMNTKAKFSGYTKYLTSGGSVYWNSLDEYSGGKLTNQFHPLVSGEHGYVMSEYKWGNLTHWTTDLDGDIAYNSYPTRLVPVIVYRANPQWVPTGRHQYYKINS